MFKFLDKKNSGKNIYFDETITDCKHSFLLKFNNTIQMQHKAILFFHIYFYLLIPVVFSTQQDLLLLVSK